MPDTEPADLDEIRQITRQALGSDFGMHDPRWMSRFHNDERQVPFYRLGRVFLAGDAAHVHSDGPPGPGHPVLCRALTQWCGAPAGQAATYGRS